MVRITVPDGRAQDNGRGDGSSQQICTDQSSKQTKEELSLLDNWKPMENDYLSKRNSYKIDTDDIGVATVGYSKCMSQGSSWERTWD